MNLLQLLRKLKKIVKLPQRDKKILLEAFSISGLVRWAILFIPFRKLSVIYGKSNGETAIEVPEDEKEIIFRIGWAVEQISYRTPWESKCLVKALTAQIMLARRKVSSTLYLGVAKDKNNKLLAHAWLRSGQVIVTGARQRSGFKEVARFAKNYGGNK
ncbi:lasso peptide biosynthesis B2 protein [Clostridium pasteurianum]|uniref:lasso peptide biosynthesis B2 protein n=1 Tax=Clostridium pasteurianum TaxID=1501 RepID=UPI002260C3D4|nr:lasso peptide biosynthesis B2 protein [Clostridium pasteurianum]UZW14952.1 lasso peptide biosynthesis B2 protein [Clostridium pasteurianum]